MPIDEKDNEETPKFDINNMKNIGGFENVKLDMDKDNQNNQNTIEEAQNESKSEHDPLASNRSATSSLRVRRTLFNANQGNFDLKQDKLTEENVEKEFGEKSRKSANRNMGIKKPIIGNTLLDDDADSLSQNSSTSLNSAIRKYLRQDLPDEALNDIGKENPFSKSQSPNRRRIKLMDPNQANHDKEDLGTPGFVEDDRSMSQDARKQLTIKTGDDQLRLKNQAKKRIIPDTNEANENLKQ